MKLVVWIVGFLILLILSVFASPQNPTKEELLATVRHIETLAVETQQDLDKEKQAHAQVAQQLDQATAQNKTLQAAIDSMSERCNKAIASLDHVLKKLHLAKWIMSGIWVAVCGLVFLKAGYPLGVYIGGGLLVAGEIAIWTMI